MSGMFMSSATALRRAAWSPNTSTLDAVGGGDHGEAALLSMIRVVWST